MAEANEDDVRERVEEVYRTESRRILATLIRLLGDFELAEDAMQEAFRTALTKWTAGGIPKNPRAWLVSTGRFKAIDVVRRQSRFSSLPPELVEQLEDQAPSPDLVYDESIEDDRLRLIFTCCHPALAPEARVALTLREVCGLSTEEIASAFLIGPATLAQRIVRAKAKIREARIPYRVPSAQDLPERLETVLQVVYLVFNEGYAASSGESLTRADLSAEAIRLGRLLLALLPDAETQGLLALMLIQESRRLARTDAQGDLVLLEDQDRALWNQAQIKEGVELVEQAFRGPEIGPYCLQAAISAVHAEATDVASTDWAQIVQLYDLLLASMPSPVVELNRAVAVAMRDEPAAGVELIERILERGELTDYYLAHSARADLLRRMGKAAEAKSAYEKALTLARQEPERRFIQKRIQLFL